MSTTFQTTCNQVIEWGYSSGQSYADPFGEVSLDVIFTTPEGLDLRVPAFWAGGQEWRVRFSAPKPGAYRFQTVCSDAENTSLHGIQGAVRVEPYAGNHLLYRHGGLGVRLDRRSLEHLDGTPFFWLADTWWLAFCDRLKWSDEFQMLTADRLTKGFSVIHLVAGLFPDMPPFDRRGANEGGFPWEVGFARINPAFFDQADLKLQWLVEQGLVPLIVGAWGYYLPILGLEKMKQHWRYLVARWGAYPVVWCLAGEVSMPFYLSDRKEVDRQVQREGWAEIGRYLRQIDPYRRPITAHTCAFGESSQELSDPACLDFNFVQTGHGNLSTAVAAARHIQQVVATAKLRPVINSETCYEGIMGYAWQDVQRFCFWSSLLSGAMGYSYGANGIWQINRPGAPFGPSPHGMSWGDTPWQEAMQLAGSAQIGMGKRLLERYHWWLFEPHQEWVEPCADDADSFQPYAAGIAGEARLVYFPYPLAPWNSTRPRIKSLEDGIKYHAFFFNPASGEQQELGIVQPDPLGDWVVPQPAIGQDLVLVMEKV